MGLIELDAAIKATWKDTGYTDPLNVMTAIRDRLEALPTVDAVPVEPEERAYWDDGDGCYYAGTGERLYTREEVRTIINGTVRDVESGIHDPYDILPEDFV